jgi:DNA topoisomerase VI subunit B
MADADVHAEFREAVNMTADELEKWLSTDESREVGQKRSEGSESTGHESGRKIVRILGKKKAELTEDDERHMRKVAGYVHRHMAQRPDGDVADSRWRRSLMNWGHDPLKQ